MKKLSNFNSLIFILITFVSTAEIFAQSGWFPCTTGTNKNLTSVNFVNQNTGWIVGYNNFNDYRGVILKTTDGGANWIMQVDEYNIQPESVFFSDINSGWVVGDRLFGLNKSVIKKTTSAGLNWLDISIPDSSIHTYSVFFVNQNTGWVSGKDNNNKLSILKTTNSGLNWLVIETDFISSTYGPKIQFVNENTGYLAALQLLKTTNGGTNWNISNIGSNVIPAQPYFINENTGWVTGFSQNPAAHYITKTTNGGNNWITQWSFAIASGHAIYSTYFINSNTGWGAGSEYVNSSYIIKTTNGGTTWGYQTSQTYSYALSSIFFTDGNYGWSIGSNGRVLRTTDGGGEVLSLESIGSKIPGNYSLKQNYPNPFNPVTYIEFQIPVAGFVRLSVCNLLGQEIETFVEKQMQPGVYKVAFDGLKHSSGIYFYTLQSGKFSETKKLVLIK